MKRKVILGKDAVLWYAGDTARTFAVIESDKLGVKTEKGLAGVLWPKMVLGEIALMGLEGPAPTRTASVFALEDGTTVTEYPAVVIKQRFDDESHLVARSILTTLVGQIGRNCMLVIAAHRLDPFVVEPVKGLMMSLSKTHQPALASLDKWEDFVFAFHYLVATRDYTETLRQSLVTAGADRDTIFRASEAVKDFFEGQKDLPFLSELLSAEREKEQWLERFTT